MVVDQRGGIHPGNGAQLLERPLHVQVAVLFHGHNQAAFRSDGVDLDARQLFELRAHMLCTLWLDVYQQARNIHGHRENVKLFTCTGKYFPSHTTFCWRSVWRVTRSAKTVNPVLLGCVPFDEQPESCWRKANKKPRRRRARPSQRKEDLFSLLVYAAIDTRVYGPLVRM